MPKPIDETEKLKDANEDKTAAKPTDAVKDNTEPRRLIIATLPRFKKQPTEQS